MKKIIASNMILLTVCMLMAQLAMPASAEDKPFDCGDSPVLCGVIKNKVLRVGINPLFKPFSFTKKVDGKDQRVGIDIDIARLLAKELGVEYKEVKPAKFSELIPMLLNDEIDIIIAAMSRIFARTKFVDFTNSYFNTGTGIMLSKIKCHELGICEARSYWELKQKLESLENEHELIIAATENKAPIKFVDDFFDVPKGNIIPFESNEDAALATLEADREKLKHIEVLKNREKLPHIMVHDEIFLNTFVQKHREEAIFKLVVFPKPYRSDSYGFAIRKGNQSFLNMLNIFIEDKLYGEGNFDKYRGEHDEYYERPTDPRRQSRN